MEEARFRWDNAKDTWLRAHRGVGFSDVVDAVINGLALEDIQHPSRPNQRIIVFIANDYVHACPYVMDKDSYFLKTIYPDRKLDEKHRKY